jgi:hypothetical protein
MIRKDQEPEDVEDKENVVKLTKTKMTWWLWQHRCRICNLKADRKTITAGNTNHQRMESKIPRKSSKMGKRKYIIGAHITKCEPSTNPVNARETQ